MGQRAQRSWSGAGRDRSSPAAPRTQMYKGEEGRICLDHEGTFWAHELIFGITISVVGPRDQYFEVSQVILAY